MYYKNKCQCSLCKDDYGTTDYPVGAMTKTEAKKYALYYCEECRNKRMFQNEHSFLTHLRYEHNNTVHCARFVCKLCAHRRFRESAHLDQHIAQHWRTK